MDNCGSYLQRRHGDKRLCGCAQQKSNRQDPDVNVAPSAYEPDKALERAKLVYHLSGGRINAGFRQTINCFRYQQQKQVTKAPGSWPEA